MEKAISRRVFLKAAAVAGAVLAVAKVAKATGQADP